MSHNRRSDDDSRWMHHAFALARKGEGLTRPNPPVGAVVISDGRIVGTGYHKKAGGPHAEVVALRNAGSKSQGATLYVTLEPCCTYGKTPPCTNMIIAAGIARVVLSVRDPNPKHRGRGIRRLQQAGIDVTEKVCSDEGFKIIAPFAKWITTGQPYVTLKLGMTLDGKIADKNGNSKWITSNKARNEVQNLRKHADAILVGHGTIVADNPSLLCKSRQRTGAFRIIVDSKGTITHNTRVLADGNADRTIIATTQSCPNRTKKMIENMGGQVWVMPTANGMVSLSALARKMGEFGLLRVVCEGGGELAS
ncbi:MAG: bifunctional diaminohydroxyphosphoribosylaminopyrimidine deaminase/5-amino-6-(5-phosphoribosylamino)uracil reductase RibD, partial [Lentisphaerae bacterium]|nr:bifunctional diaminohydroxyphosphoribosylaminopyrimidine deaminase/5-amino-6-(5-phosphoribosylamino)uracil reductase RibD [Lentisphaerota bacterium]